MVSSKGKEVAGKRKRSDTGSSCRKRRNRGVLQFFDDIAYEVHRDSDSESSDNGHFIDDVQEDECKAQVEVNNEPERAHYLPFLSEVGEFHQEELEKMVEERYKPASSFLTYAEEEYESNRSIAGNAVRSIKGIANGPSPNDPNAVRSIAGNAVGPSPNDPTIWKVKCTVGGEKHSAFCLMQKYVDLQSLGTKLQIISAFVIEHVKGLVYIEAERQFDVNEACKGLYSLHPNRMAPVPKNEVSLLFSVQSKCIEVSVGTWARVKNGKYKGDLAQVVAVNEARKKATVKLIPRVDLQLMVEKLGGGIVSKKTAIPAPRLISSTELEEFRPLVQYRRDRDTRQTFEFLDGLMLKDGYLFKKVSINSLIFRGLMPSEDEIREFEPFKKLDSDCEEWLTELYSEQEEKHKSKKGGGNEEGSSSSSMVRTFEVHELVLFNQKDFGVIVGTGKDESFKILKGGSEGPVVVTVGLRQLKNWSLHKKITGLDHCSKTISINDTVRVLEGPLQGRQGIIKHIYRGIVFLYDAHEQENSGYICCKSQICERIQLCDEAHNGEGGKSGSTGFDDFLPSHKSSQSPTKRLSTRENKSNWDKDGTFSIGQSLRIRAGALKGYMCRVMAVSHSDVTVKLDSQQKTLTVKCEHLTEVHVKSPAVSLCNDADPVKPFDLLGTQDCSGGRTAGAGTSNEKKKCRAGGLSAVRSSRPALPSSGFSLHPESKPDDNMNKGVGALGSKVTPNQNSSRGRAVAGDEATGYGEQAGKKWNNRDDSGGGKVSWNGSISEQESHQTVGTCNSGRSSWNKQDANTAVEYKEMTVKNGSWGKPPSGARGFGAWNKNSMGNKDQIYQQGAVTPDRGCGSGGRRGRGASRGGRDQFGGGRSFRRGNSSRWSGQCTSDGLGSDRGGFRGRGRSQRGGFGGRGCGWKSDGGGRNLNQGGYDNGRSWNFGRESGGGDAQTGGWNTRTDSANNVGGRDVAVSGWMNQSLVFDGGRGGSNRGGFEGRGQSHRGGYGGRGRSGRGGFRGGGRLERGGFRGRGRGTSRNAKEVGYGGKGISGNGGASGTWNLLNATNRSHSPSWNQNMEH